MTHEPSNQVYRAQIPPPAAWTVTDAPNKASFVREITREEADAAWALVDQTHGASTEAISRAMFEHPAIANLMRAVHAELLHGKGAIVLSGLDLDHRSPDDFARLLWGLSTHLGEAAPQTVEGDRICRVQHETDVPAAGIGYRRNIKLLPHSDFHEVLTLAAYQRPETGGETGLVSAGAIHNILLQERPDLLEALYQGYFHVAPRSERLLSGTAPVFCNVDGALSLSFHFAHHETAARLRDEKLPRALIEARDFVLEVATRPELHVTFPLERGDILFWHNFTVLHSRAPFADSAAHKRLLFRLWLHLNEGRPMHPSFNQRARQLDRVLTPA